MLSSLNYSSQNQLQWIFLSSVSLDIVGNLFCGWYPNSCLWSFCNPRHLKNGKKARHDKLLQISQSQKKISQVLKGPENYLLGIVDKICERVFSRRKAHCKTSANSSLSLVFVHRGQLQTWRFVSSHKNCLSSLRESCPLRHNINPSIYWTNISNKNCQLNSVWGHNFNNLCDSLFFLKRWDELRSYFFILVDGHRTIPNDHPQTQLISRNQHQYWRPQNRLASQRMFLNGFWRTILVSGNLITPPSPSLWCVLQIQKANKGVNGGSWHSFGSMKNLAFHFVWNYYLAV